jgi:hypothetical protein
LRDSPAAPSTTGESQVRRPTPKAAPHYGEAERAAGQRRTGPAPFSDRRNVGGLPDFQGSGLASAMAEKVGGLFAGAIGTLTAERLWITSL